MKYTDIFSDTANPGLGAPGTHGGNCDDNTTEETFLPITPRQLRSCPL